jgi:hypothetical protein
LVNFKLPCIDVDFADAFDATANAARATSTAVIEVMKIFYMNLQIAF